MMLFQTGNQGFDMLLKQIPWNKKSWTHYFHEWSIIIMIKYLTVTNSLQYFIIPIIKITPLNLLWLVKFIMFQQN